MRVTQSMLSTNMLKHLSNSYKDMDKLQQQLLTGKKISRPSDDPVVAAKGMRYRESLTSIDQHERNLNEVKNWMEATDSSLDKATNVMQRIRELAVQLSNDTYDSSQRDLAAKEIRQLKEHLVDIGNTKVENKYIFNGTNTNTKPVDSSVIPITVSTNTDVIKIEVSKGVELQVNINPTDVFTAQLFNDIEQFITDLETPGSTHSAVGASISKMESHMDKMIAVRSEQGARQNRVDLIESRLSEQRVISERILSNNEDAEIEKVITELKIRESIHRNALSVGSRIIQPTLMDFLR